MSICDLSYGDTNLVGRSAVATGVHPGEDTVIILRELGSVSGTAVMPDGTPVTSFQLSVRDLEGRTLATTDGHWSLSRVVPGNVQLLAFNSSRGAAEASVELAPGEKRAGIALQFQPPPPDEAPTELRGPTP